MATLHPPNQLVKASDCQLVLVDVQSRLASVMSDAETLVNNCNILLTAANLLQVPTIITEQYPKGLGPTDSTLLETTRSFSKNVPVIGKTCFSCHGSDDFQSTVERNNRQQTVLCGIEAHVCILQTAMDLLVAGKTVFVVADAVDSRSPSNKQLALQRISAAGGIVAATESVLFEWLKDSRHKQFKAVTALIR